MTKSYDEIRQECLDEITKIKHPLSSMDVFQVGDALKRYVDRMVEHAESKLENHRQYAEFGRKYHELVSDLMHKLKGQQ